MPWMPLFSRPVSPRQVEEGFEIRSWLEEEGVPTRIYQRGSHHQIVLVDAVGETLDARLRWLAERRHPDPSEDSNARFFAFCEWPCCTIGRDGPELEELLEGLCRCTVGGPTMRQRQVLWPEIVEAVSRLVPSEAQRLRSRRWLPWLRLERISENEQAELLRTAAGQGWAALMCRLEAPASTRLRLLFVAGNQLESFDDLADATERLRDQPDRSWPKDTRFLSAEPTHYLAIADERSLWEQWMRDPRFEDKAWIVRQKSGLVDVSARSRHVVPLLDIIDPSWHGQ